MNNDKTIYCTFVCDSAYVTHTAVSIYSIIKNLNPNFSCICFVICVGFNKKPATFIKMEQKFKNLKIECIVTKKYDDYFPKELLKYTTLHWINISAFYRLLMFKLLPNYVDWAVYLDSDAIVDFDLSSLVLSLDKNKMFYAVLDPWVILNRKTVFGYLRDLPEFSKYKNDYNKYGYFNSGFYIANIPLCHKHNVFKSLMEYIKNNPHPHFFEQDSLNAVFSQIHHDKIKYLPLEYNIFANLDKRLLYRKSTPYQKSEIDKAYFKPNIIHYTGKNKPWLNNKTKYLCDKWRNYADELGVVYKNKDHSSCSLSIYNFFNWVNNFIIIPPGSYRRAIAKKIIKTK